MISVNRVLIREQSASTKTTTATGGNYSAVTVSRDPLMYANPGARALGPWKDCLSAVSVCLPVCCWPWVFILSGVGWVGNMMQHQQGEK